MRLWIQALNQELGESGLTVCRNVGKGYFLLKGEDTDALNNAMMLSPFRSKWGTCMLQSWVPGFNPDNPSNLAFPTWISLRNMPYEHQDQAIAIAETLGEVIGMDTANENSKDPRFCVNLEINKGWATCIVLESEEGILPPQTIMVDYEKLPIRCRVCLSWKHKANVCEEFQKRPMKGRGRQGYAQQAPFQDKGKTANLDRDGFQQVQYKKGIRRNIFGNNHEEIHTHNLEFETGTGHIQPKANGAAATAATEQDKGENPEQSHDMQLSNEIPACDTEELYQHEGGEGGQKAELQNNRRSEHLDTSKHLNTEGGAKDTGAQTTGKNTRSNGILGDLEKAGNTAELLEVARPSTTTEGQVAIEEEELAPVLPEQDANQIERESWKRGHAETISTPRKEGGKTSGEHGMNWSPTKLAGQKRSSEALDIGEGNSHESDEGSEDQEEREETELRTEEGYKDGQEVAVEKGQGLSNWEAGEKGREGKNFSHEPACGAGEEAGNGPGAAGAVDRRVKGKEVPDCSPIQIEEQEQPGSSKGDKPKRGIGVKSKKPNNKAPRLESHGDQRMELEREDGAIFSMRPEPPHLTGTGHVEVIPETQLNEVIRRSNIYNDIMASIGLDSPTPSQDSRGGVVNHGRHGQESCEENTPIRNSAANLIALGKHMLTPRQGRIWEHRNKSPLGDRTSKDM